jgi:hypothetical protein
MIKLGDKVKVIPHSYIDLAKRDLHQQHALEEASAEEGKSIMLGGVYQVLAIEQEFSPLTKKVTGVFYKLIPGDSKAGNISGSFLLPLNEVELCPFKVNDLILFRPKCSQQDLEYLKILDSLGLNDRDKVHKATSILNDYYIFIDRPIDDPYAFPFRWIDFQPKKDK